MEAYIAELVGVYREVWRVLRDDGVVWLNLGDSYASQPKGNPGARGNINGGKRDTPESDAGSAVANKQKLSGLKPKDLCGIPWRIALALQADGWYLRSDIIWSKPNPMRQSATDRCCKSHEYIFQLTKSSRYWFDEESIKVPSKEKTFTVNTTPRKGTGIESTGEKVNLWMEENGGRYHPAMSKKLTVWEVRDDETLLRWLEENHPSVFDEYVDESEAVSDVWRIATRAYKGAHFATFPPKLVEPCILAGCPEVCCAECGAGHVRILEKVRRPTRPGDDSKVHRINPNEQSEKNRHRLEAGMNSDKSTLASFVGNRDPERHVTETITTGWQPSCECNAGTKPGVVLDQFGGSGTTGEVAKDLGRRFILCELNPEYVKLMKKRLKQGALC